MIRWATLYGDIRASLLVGNGFECSAVRRNCETRVRDVLVTELSATARKPAGSRNVRLAQESHTASNSTETSKPLYL